MPANTERRFSRRVIAKEPAAVDAAPAKTKMVDIPYETRVFRKPGGEEVPVAGFRERLQAAYKQHDAANKKTFADVQAVLEKYKESLKTLETATEYDIKSLVASVQEANQSNAEVYEAINVITGALSTMASSYPDIDETATQIIQQMMDELVGVGALNASNEMLKSLTDYVAEFDEITVNFYRVTGGGKDKGERVREYYTYKKTKQVKKTKAGEGYKNAMLRLANQLKVILGNATESGAELVKFSKEVIDVMELWSMYLDTKTKKKLWKGKEITNDAIPELLMGYDFYKEIASDLSLRREDMIAGPSETKLHAMLAKIKAKIESIANAPAYAAGVMQERMSASVEFVKEAAQGLREITAEIYGMQLEEQEGKGLVDKVKDFAEDMIPEPMMAGAMARQRILAMKEKAVEGKEPWEMTADEYANQDTAYRKAHDAWISAMERAHGRGDRWGETRRFSGKSAGLSLERIERASKWADKKYEDAKSRHAKIVEQAIKEGKKPSESSSVVPSKTPPMPTDEKVNTHMEMAASKKVKAYLSLDGSSLKDSDVSYFEIGVGQTMGESLQLAKGAQPDIREDLMDAAFSTAPSLIDWTETTADILDDDYQYREGDGIYFVDTFRENPEPDELMAKGATFKDAFLATFKARKYVDFNKEGVVFDVQAVNDFMADAGWRIINTEDNETYAILWY